MSDYESLKFKMTIDEMELASHPAFAKNFNPRLNRALAQATMKAVNEGDKRAIYAPVINYGIQSALRGLKIPSVRDRLPREINHRSLVAERLGSIVAREGAERDEFVRAYADSDYLRQGLNKDSIVGLQDPEFLAKYFSAPWAEARQVMGGAFKTLGSQEIYEGRDRIVANSRGLQIAALVPAEARKKHIKPFLGIPYADIEHFDVHTHELSTTVVFNQEARDFIGQYLVSGRGCSAAAVHPEGGREGSLLQQSFADMTAVLLFGDAVAT